MTVDAKEEWQAVAPSGRIVTSFGTVEQARKWRTDHPEHNVRMEQVITVTVRTEMQ